MYWTLGKYDTIVIIDGPDEKAAMRSVIRWGDLISTETLVALKRGRRKTPRIVVGSSNKISAETGFGGIWGGVWLACRF
jgi:hypothetical protein